MATSKRIKKTVPALAGRLVQAARVRQQPHCSVQGRGSPRAQARTIPRPPVTSRGVCTVRQPWLQHRNPSVTLRRRCARVVVQRSHDVTPHRQQLAVEQTLGQKAAAAHQARATAHLTSFATGSWSHSSNQGHRRVVPRENDGRGAARDQRHAAHRPQPAAAAAAAQAALHCGATAPCSFVPLLHLR